MDGYKTRSLESASGVELVVALYDGIIAFMHRAISAVESKDESARRRAVKRAMDIVIHLQATLRRDVGGKPAECLSEFYAAVFALMLQGSMADSREHFEKVIACVANVRDAWRQVALDPQAGMAATERRIAPRLLSLAATPPLSEVSEGSSGWTA